MQGKTALESKLAVVDFNEAPDDRVALAYMQILRYLDSRQITMLATQHSIFYGQMLFMMLKRQCQRIEGYDVVLLVH